MTKPNEQTEAAPETRAGATTPPAVRGQPYEAPALHEVGDLSKLQHYGFYYNDGYRYKNDY